MTETHKRFTLDDVRIPPYAGDATMATVLGDYIIFVKKGYSTDDPNPLEEFGGAGAIYSLGSRHSNYNPERVKEAVESDPDAVPLSYFEHGNCIWGVAEGFLARHPGTAGDFRWDGVRFAGVWVPDEHLRKTADDAGEAPGSVERRARMRQYAEQACTTYTAWANGEVYRYAVEAYPARSVEGFGVYDDRSDYRYDKPVFEDSCSGIYDDDDHYFDKSVREAVQEALNKINRLYADHAR